MKNCEELQKGRNTSLVFIENKALFLFFSRNSKSKIIYEGPHSITNLAFKNQNHDIVLFISTEHHVMVLNILAKSKDQSRVGIHFCSVFGDRES